MKTKIQIISFVLAALVLGACSSKLQLSRSPGQGSDDVYYSPSQQTSTSTQQEADNSSLKRSSGSDLDLAELEKKYAGILANDTNQNLDTLVYKAKEEENPYERVLVDSYAESWERRMRARSNYSHNPYFSDDLWYAMSYDPAFYNVIIMGSEVWVEPSYISSMFYRPYYYGSSFSYGWGYRPWGGYGYDLYGGWGYPYNYWGFSYGWYGGYYYSPYYWYNPWSPWGYFGWNSYAWGYNNGYWDGYNWGDNNYYHNANYGTRPNNDQGAVINTGTRPGGGTTSAGINDTKRGLSEKQIVLEKQDPTGTKVTGEREIVDKQEGTRSGNVVTRPSRESLNINPTRVVDTKREFATKEKTRESYNPSYSKPKPANSNEFNRTSRNYPSTEAVRSEQGTKQTPVAVPQRGTKQERIYNPPARTAPTNRESGGNRSGSSNSNSGSRYTPSSSGSSSSGSGTRSSSGSSSSSSSGSSSRSSSSSSTRNR